MHPYMIEKLAASRRDDFLVVADRQRRLAQAGRSQRPSNDGAKPFLTKVASALSSLFQSEPFGPDSQAARRPSAGYVRPTPW